MQRPAGWTVTSRDAAYSLSRANLVEATWLLLDMMRRAVVARQVVGASGTWRLSHGHSEEALITRWPPANKTREEKGD